MSKAASSSPVDRTAPMLPRSARRLQSVCRCARKALQDMRGAGDALFRAIGGICLLALLTGGGLAIAAAPAEEHLGPGDSYPVQGNHVLNVTVRDRAGLSLSRSGAIGRNVHIDRGDTLVMGEGGTIGGDLSMASGAVIAAANSGQALAVDGGVSLAEGMQVMLHGSGWSPGTYALLAPSNPSDLDGFTDIRVPGFLEEYRVARQDGKLVLHYSQRNADGLSGNRKRTFNALRSLDTSSALYQALGGANAADIGKALDTLSGEAHATLHGNLALIDKSFSRRLSGHISRSSLARRPILVDESSYMDPGEYDRFATYSGNYYGSGYGLWGTVGGTYASVDGSDGTAKSTLQGPEVAIGLDGFLNDGVVAGIAFQYSYKDLEVDGRDSDAEINSYSFALYAGRELDVADNVLRLVIGGIYSYHDLKTSRQVRIASLREDLDADYKGQSLRLYAEGAYSMVVSEKFHLEPFLNIGWNWQRTGNFSESGGLAALKGNSGHMDNMSTLLGMRFDLPVQDALRMNAFVGWEHIYGSMDPELSLNFRHGGGGMRIRGNSPGRDELALGLGAGLLLTDTLNVHINYEGGIGGDSESHGGAATLIYRW